MKKSQISNISFGSMLIMLFMEHFILFVIKTIHFEKFNCVAIAEILKTLLLRKVVQ